jgi:pimeloyl-ACP methyl ester carboxylesterase
MSDAVPVQDLPTLEERMDDVRAVMDAAGSARAALIGVSEGGEIGDVAWRKLLSSPVPGSISRIAACSI